MVTDPMIACDHAVGSYHSNIFLDSFRNLIRITKDYPCNRGYGTNMNIDGTFPPFQCKICVISNYIKFCKPVAKFMHESSDVV